MTDPYTLSNMLGERIGTPTSVAESLVTPLAASPLLCDALAMWVARDEIADVGACGYTVAMLTTELGIPPLSAILLLGWLERDSDRLYPRFASGYADLVACKARPAVADPRALARRIIEDTRSFSDINAIGYELLACMPEIQLALWEWWQSGELPDLRIEGFSARKLAEPSTRDPGRHPTQALLSLDWLIKEPERARAFLATR